MIKKKKETLHAPQKLSLHCLVHTIAPPCHSQCSLMATISDFTFSHVIWKRTLHTCIYEYTILFTHNGVYLYISELVCKREAERNIVTGQVWNRCITLQLSITHSTVCLRLWVSTYTYVSLYVRVCVGKCLKTRSLTR